MKELECPDTMYEDIPFKLEKTGENVLEVRQKLSRRRQKELKDKTAVVRVYVFDEKDFENLKNAKVVDLEGNYEKGFISSIISFFK